MGKIRNQGSASLEATLVMSVFLLAMVSLFWYGSECACRGTGLRGSGRNSRVYGRNCISWGSRYGGCIFAVSKVCR